MPLRFLHTKSQLHNRVDLVNSKRRENTQVQFSRSCLFVLDENRVPFSHPGSAQDKLSCHCQHRSKLDTVLCFHVTYRLLLLIGSIACRLSKRHQDDRSIHIYGQISQMRHVIRTFWRMDLHQCDTSLSLSFSRMRVLLTSLCSREKRFHWDIDYSFVASPQPLNFWRPFVCCTII